MNIEDITTFATIKGKATFDAGVFMQDGVLISGVESLAVNQIVEVSVPYSAYSAGAQGEKIFTTTVSENGDYSIEIPVGLNLIAANIEIAGFYSDYNENVDNKIKKHTDILYKGVSQAIALAANNIEYMEISSARITPLDNDKLTKTVNIKGYVMAVAEGFTDNQKTNLRRDSIAVDSVLFIELTNTNDQDRSIESVIKVLPDGSYEATLKYYEEWNIQDVSISAHVKTTYQSLRHYYRELGVANWNSQIIMGIYQARSVNTNFSANNEFFTFQMPFIYRNSYTAENKEIIKGIGNAIDYENGEQIYELNDPLNLK